MSKQDCRGSPCLLASCELNSSAVLFEISLSVLLLPRGQRSALLTDGRSVYNFQTITLVHVACVRPLPGLLQFRLHGSQHPGLCSTYVCRLQQHTDISSIDILHNGDIRLHYGDISSIIRLHHAIVNTLQTVHIIRLYHANT